MLAAPDFENRMVTRGDFDLRTERIATPSTTEMLRQIRGGRKESV